MQGPASLIEIKSVLKRLRLNKRQEQNQNFELRKAIKKVKPDRTVNSNTKNFNRTSLESQGKENLRNLYSRK